MSSSIKSISLLKLSLLTSILSTLIVVTESAPYQYHSYRNILDTLSHLAKQYPRYIRTYDALDRWPHIADKSSWAQCGSSNGACTVQVIQITDFDKNVEAKKSWDSGGGGQSSWPEVFISGALHGDETIGPQVVVEIADLLVKSHIKATDPTRDPSDPDVKRSKELFYLTQHRSLFMISMTNPWGYYHKQRLEQRMDPNRDFPYLQDPKKCMQTVTARVVNELMREHLFRALITFHGGTRALSYEWGSRNHAHGSKSTEPPDDAGQVQIASKMRWAAGMEGKRWFYPMGRMTDLIYWVDGGLEDWSYAASWEGSPRPIGHCSPNSYKPYPIEKTTYTDKSKANIKTIVYLVETDNMKAPRENTLGSTDQLYANPDTNSYRGSHLPRNMRMTLKFLELMEPGVRLEYGNSGELSGVHGIGCVNMDYIKIVKVKKEGCTKSGGKGKVNKISQQSQQQIFNLKFGVSIKDEHIEKEVHQWKTEMPCKGLDLWENSAQEKAVLGDSKGIVKINDQIRKKIVDAYKTSSSDADSCFAIVSQFDSSWGEQKNPDPNIKPQTHLVRARIENNYSVTLGGSKINSSKRKAFFFSFDSESAIVGKSSTTTKSESLYNSGSGFPVTPLTKEEKNNHGGQTSSTVTSDTNSEISTNSNIPSSDSFSDKDSDNSKSNSSIIPAILVPFIPNSASPMSKITSAQSASRRTLFLLSLLVISLMSCNLWQGIQRHCRGNNMNGNGEGVVDVRDFIQRNMENVAD